MPATRAEIARIGPLRRAWYVLVALLGIGVLALATVAVIQARTAESGPPSGVDAGSVLLDPELPDLLDPGPALAADAADEPIPDPAILAARLGPTLVDPRLGERLLGRVSDVSTGEVLFDSAGDTAGTPASTAKLVTAYAALRTLDPESRLRTQVLAGSVPGQVVLVGGGDVTLSRAGPSPTYPEAASMSDLAAQLTDAGPVTSIVVDTARYTGAAVSPGWAPGDAPSTYAAPISPVMVDAGRVSSGGRQRSSTPDLDAGVALAAALGNPAIPVTQGAAAAEAQLLAEVSSPPISRLVEFTLALSDNVLAEILSREVALATGLPGDFASGGAAVTAAVVDGGLDATGLALIDGSGLAAADTVPPRLLVDLLRLVAGGSQPRIAPIASGLPVAGYDGTLAERYDGGLPVGAGSVRAKTGTLAGVNALAGYVVTADGRLLAFSLIADRLPPGSLIGAEPVLDALAGTLAGCGCS